MTRRIAPPLSVGIAVWCALALAPLQSGCQPSVDQHTVASAMQGNTADEQHVVSVGEKAIPLVFSEMRSHPDAQHWLGAVRLVEAMVNSGTADDSAPSVRQALRDPHQSTDVRCLAAFLSTLYWNSDTVLQALTDCGANDRSVRVRVRCTSSAGTLVSIRAARKRNWSMDTRLVAFFSSKLKDKDPSVRQAAVDAVCAAANSALVEGRVELPWASSLLSGAKNDPARSVRKAAISALLRLQQTKRKSLHQHWGNRGGNRGQSPVFAEHTPGPPPTTTTRTAG